MVGHQSPGIALCVGLRNERTQSLQEAIAIVIVHENGVLGDAAGDNVMQGAGCIDAGLAGHVKRIADAPGDSNLQSEERPSLG